MTSSDRLLICDAPVNDIWHLGPLDGSTEHCLLVGWNFLPGSVDAEMPQPVVRALSNTLVALGPVTFIAPPAINDDGDGRIGAQDSLFVAEERDSGWRSLAASLIGRRVLTLVSTERADLAALLFDEPGWSQQGQVAILGKVDAASLDRGVVDALAGTEWQEAAGRLTAAGLAGLCKPGVDGDVALLFFAHADRRADAIDRLIENAALQGLAADVVTEEALRLGLAGLA